MATTFDHDYYYADMIGVDFLRLLTEDAGDVTVGDATAVGEYSFATAATLSEMLDEAQTFWTDGVAESGGGDAVTGFSTTTPKTYFDSFRDDEAASGDWSGSGAPGRGWAKALRYWHGQWGYDATVEAIWSWLMAFTSNSDGEDDEASDWSVARSRIGSYDPYLALAESLDTANETNAVTGGTPALYDWATTGLLAGILGEQNPTKLGIAKEALAHRRQRGGEYTAASDQRDDLRLLVFSGLQYQTGYTDTPTRTWDVAGCAMAMNIYRNAPEAYPTVRP